MDTDGRIARAQENEQVDACKHRYASRTLSDASLSALAARTPAAAREEGFRVRHREDVAQRLMLVRGAGVVRLHDAVADPVPEVGGLAGRRDAVVKPVRNIGL